MSSSHAGAIYFIWGYICALRRRPQARIRWFACQLPEVHEHQQRALSRSGRRTPVMATIIIVCDGNHHQPNCTRSLVRHLPIHTSWPLHGAHLRAAVISSPNPRYPLSGRGHRPPRTQSKARSLGIHRKHRTPFQSPILASPRKSKDVISSPRRTFRHKVHDAHSRPEIRREAHLQPNSGFTALARRLLRSTLYWL